MQNNRNIKQNHQKNKLIKNPKMHAAFKERNQTACIHRHTGQQKQQATRQ